MTSLTRLRSDACTYSFDLKQSTGPGQYLIGTPRIECQACYSTDPTVRMSSIPRISTGISESANRSLVDVESDLFLIDRKASLCPIQKFLPTKDEGGPLVSFPDCKSLPREDTRLSNPTCTLRCSGWNRWEWLCQNPQDNALIPFDFNISNRLVVKDNHRPCLPKPMNQDAALPQNKMCDGHNTMDRAPSYPGDVTPLNIGNQHWRRC